MIKSENFILVLSICLIILSIINISISFDRLDLIQKLTGYASYGYVNLSVLTYVSINLSVDSISWGSGNINSGQLNATLYTVGNGSGVVARGNWSGENVSALVVENMGNTNCSLSIQTGKDAHDFFNSLTNSNEQYMINVSNKEGYSCSGDLLGLWNSANKTSGGTKFCNNFEFNKSRNEIYIDVLFTIPYDAGNIGQQSDEIVIIGDAT